MFIITKPMRPDLFRFVTLQQLEALVNLVEERSFSKAAERMALTQPSLSKHIKNLEELAGTHLVDRTKNGVSLTPEGTILYGYARRIIRLREEAREKIALARTSVAGVVYAGASTIPATYILPHVLTLLAASHPDVKVHVTTHDTQGVIHMVLSGQVELGFVGEPVSDRRMISEPLWSDELVLVACARHRWAERGSISLEDLFQEPFVLREKGSGTRSVFERYLSERYAAGIDRLRVACEMGSTEAVKESVIVGLGVSVLSVHAVRRELASGILVRVNIPGMKILRNFSLLRRKQFTLLPHHKAFMEAAAVYNPEA